MRVLDVGCGAGGLLYHLDKLGFRNLTGVDVSPEQVKLARQQVPAARIIEGDLREVLSAREQEYDLILAFDIIEHFRRDEILAFLSLVRDNLRSGGRLILQTPNAASPFFGSVGYGDFTHEWFFTPSSLSNVLTLVGFRQPQTRENRPNVHGVKSFLRALGWAVLRMGPLVWDAVETGGTGSRIYSRVFVATAVK